jgi:hypothetical protein
MAEAGLLMSYGTSLADMFRQVGIYTDSILNGTKPTELPVLQSTKFRIRDQSADGAFTADRNSTYASRPRRRGDRITTYFTGAQNVRFWHKADIKRLSPNVCFRG